MRISEVLQAKASAEVVTISPDAGVRELIASLAEHNVGALIVSSDGSTVDGIVSEVADDDIARVSRIVSGDDLPVLDAEVVEDRAELPALPPTPTVQPRIPSRRRRRRNRVAGR